VHGKVSHAEKAQHFAAAAPIPEGLAAAELAAGADKKSHRLELELLFAPRLGSGAAKGGGSKRKRQDLPQHRSLRTSDSLAAFGSGSIAALMGELASCIAESCM